MKIFLSLNGIIYVLGISHDRVVDLITRKYGVERSDEYLKKFVQIPITLSEWNELEIGQTPQNETERANLLKDDSSINTQLRNILRKYKTDEKLWEFLIKNYQTLKDMRWDTFRRITNFVSDYYEDPSIRALSMLKARDIQKFNSKRGENGEFAKLDLGAADLSKLDIESANLRKTGLRNVKLEGARLYSVSFSGSDLTDANISRAKLLFTSFTLANLTGAILTNVNFDVPYQEYISYDADYDIDLSRSVLTKANFSGAKLRDAVIISPESFDGMIVDNETDFSNAIIDDEAFVEYLKKNTQKVTAHIKSKEELRRIFKERGFDEKRIDFLLSLSKRPWRVPGEPLTSDVLESWIRLFEQQLANWYNESVTTQGNENPTFPVESIPRSRVAGGFGISGVSGPDLFATVQVYVNRTGYISLEDSGEFRLTENGKRHMRELVS